MTIHSRMTFALAWACLKAVFISHGAETLPGGLRAPSIELAYEMPHMLVMRGDHLPGREIRVNYLEAYCRAGSTDADWVQHTVIPHRVELLSLSADRKTLRLRDTLADGVVVEHTIVAGSDEVDFRLIAHNPGTTRSEAHWAQPCVRLAEFMGFDPKGKDLDDYLPKCFIFLDGKLTRLPEVQPWAKQARYVPGQVWCPAHVPRTDVNPRPLSPLVPSNGLIGAFSGDEKWIFATAWDPYQELFQGVIRCLHSDFRLGGLQPGETLPIHGKVYLVTNDVPALMTRYARDFPTHDQTQRAAAEKLTSLDNPSIAYTVPEKPYTILRRGEVEAVVVDNRAVNDAVLPGHAAGYHGVAALRHARQSRSLFVPAYSGLNFEHIHDGTIQPRDILFEPRRAPMELRLVSPHVAELYQPPTPHWGLESCMRYELLPDGTIEMTFECIPRRDTYRNGYIGLFWASYIDRPESLDIHFQGAAEGSGAAWGWQRGTTPAHGTLATHRALGDDRVFEHDSNFPLELPFGFSKQRYSSPWYFGVCRGMAWLQSFRPQDRVWLSQSPSGGGAGCPAWDFQWHIAQPQIGKRYQLTMRATYLPLAQPNDLGAVRTEVLKAVPQASRPTPWPADTFLHSWQVLGPIPVAVTGTPDEAARKRAFETDFLAGIGGEAALVVRPEAPVTIAGKGFTWRAIAETHDVIPLGTVLGLQDDVIAYAYTEVDMPEATRVSLGLGSDDGIRVWLNGVLVHQNWVGREAAPDSDLIAVELQKGRNRLLVKIQNMQGPWGFACRRMGPVSLSNRLITAAYQGDLDQVRRLAELGADLNPGGAAGITPAMVARIRGETEILAFLSARGVDVSQPLPDPAVLANRRFSSLFKPDGPGAAVLVSRRGQVLFERGYGMADIGNRVPATPATRFRIGSVTKQFAAAAILKLQENGQLNVTNTLAQYFPDFPGGDKVTLHHLLTHTSGIHSYTSKPGFLESAPLGTQPEAHIRSFQNDPYDFPPGERWSYNNSGYFLLGSIIEKVSGQSWGDYLDHTFFTPLNMEATGVHTATDILAHEARGYAFENGRFQKAIDWDMSKAGAAGALYSTVGDLHRWNEGVFRTQVVTTASLQAAFTPVRTRDETAVEPGPKTTGYGYGWSIAKFRGLQEISHGGGLNGFVSFLLRLPQEEFTVAVLVNCAPPPPGVDPGALAHELAEIYLADVLAPRTKPSVDSAVTEEDLAPLVGHYNYGNAFLEVTREGKRLFAQLTGQPRYEIFPRSSTHFFWKSVDAEISFVKDSQGVVTRATHQQGGQTLQAPRVADLAVVPVNAAALESYAGRYDYGGGQAILTVTREGSRLFAQLTGQPRFEIYPKSETEFQWKVVAAQVTFVKGTDGKVTHVVHQQGGNRFEAPRLP